MSAAVHALDIQTTIANTLRLSEPETKSYYDYVREQIDNYPVGVNSLASLKDYAKNLTRRDDWRYSVMTTWITQARERQNTMEPNSSYISFCY